MQEDYLEEEGGDKMPELPKVSQLLRPLVDLETTAKGQIESTTGLTMPPGVLETTSSLLETVETSLPSPELPAGLPELPSLEEIKPSSSPGEIKSRKKRAKLNV